MDIYSELYCLRVAHVCSLGDKGGCIGEEFGFGDSWENATDYDESVN